MEEQICPVGNTLDLFNRKWVFCILANVFNGAKRFKEFKELNPEISNHVLSQTLKYMVENELLEKNIEGNKTEYILTEKGLKSNKIIYELAMYSIDNLEYSTLDENYKKEIKEEFKRNLKLEE